MAGKIRNFTQETYDEFSRNIRDDFVEDNLLLGEINSAFSTPEVGEDIDVIKSHNSVTKFKGAIAQFYLNKVFRDVYEVEQEYVGHFDEIVQTIHLKTRNLKYLTDSIGRVTDPINFDSCFRFSVQERYCAKYRIRILGICHH